MYCAGLQFSSEFDLRSLEFPTILFDSSDENTCEHGHAKCSEEPEEKSIDSRPSEPSSIDFHHLSKKSGFLRCIRRISIRYQSFTPIRRIDHCSMMTERVEGIFAMISAHATRTNTTEGQRKRSDLKHYIAHTC